MSKRGTDPLPFAAGERLRDWPLSRDAKPWKRQRCLQLQHVHADRCQMLTSGPQRVCGADASEPGTLGRRVGVHGSKQAKRQEGRMETGLPSPS